MKVNDTRKVTGSAFIGKDGQDKYELIVHFGKSSLRRYANGTRIEECIPSPETDNWIIIDLQNRIAEIYLK